MASGSVTHDFRDGHDHCAGGGSTNAVPRFGFPVDMDKSMYRSRVYLGFPVGLEQVLEEEKKNPASACWEGQQYVGSGG